MVRQGELGGSLEVQAFLQAHRRSLHTAGGCLLFGVFVGKDNLSWSKKALGVALWGLGWNLVFKARSMYFEELPSLTKGSRGPGGQDGIPVLQRRVIHLDLLK